MVTKRAFTMRVVLLEAIGFGAVIAGGWLNELLDLPHWLAGAPATPVNWTESLMETAVVALLGAITCLWTWRAVARIRYLEGILRVCSYCKRICMDDRWVTADVYIAERTEAMCSHGICPDCLREHHADFADPHT